MIRFRSADLTFMHRQIDSISYTTETGHAMISYGYRQYRQEPTTFVVDFVVIESATHAENAWIGSLTKGKQQNGDATAILTTPTGKEVELPGDFVVYQISNGTMKTSLHPVTQVQLDSFLERYLAHPTIDDLVPTAAEQ